MSLRELFIAPPAGLWDSAGGYYLRPNILLPDSLVWLPGETGELAIRLDRIAALEPSRQGAKISLKPREKGGLAEIIEIGLSPERALAEIERQLAAEAQTAPAHLTPLWSATSPQTA